jgi:hypothetical protein
MRKIARAATIDAAYGFFFRNIISIIGIVWFPALIFAGVAAAVIATVVPHEWLFTPFNGPADLETFVETRLSVFMTATPIIGFVGLVTVSMMRVGILERVLGNRTGLTLFYFSLGGRVWRMAGAAVLAGIVMGAVALVEIVAGVALHFAVSAIPNIALGLVILFDVLQVIAWIVALVYIGIRQFFFLPAVIVAENRIGFRRAWSLGAGNVGRALVVLLAIVVPICFVTGIISEFSIMPALFPVMEKFSSRPDPEMAGAFLNALLPVLPIMLIIHLIGALAVTGTLLGAIGRAYQAVTADETV